MGGCKGVLTIADNEIVFDSQKDKDDRQWQYSELSDLSFGANMEIRFTADSTYKFRLRGDPYVPSDVLKHLRRRIKD